MRDGRRYINKSIINRWTRALLVEEAMEAIVVSHG